MDSLCPFSGQRRSSSQDEELKLRPLQAANKKTLTKVPTGKARVQLLYEEYVHLPQLRAVWESPITCSPFLEPCFVAAMHGIELGFLLLSEFISDSRTYVSKRPRIELVADDIAKQCRLLVDVIDGELEEEDTTTSRLSLTQEFPFPDAPPTTTTPSHSPGLARLIAAIKGKYSTMSQVERNSLIKVVLNLSAAFSAFQRWSVGLGIEPQLNELRLVVGLAAEEEGCCDRLWLDYEALVRPWVVDQTLTAETYVHAEDFFFRTVHLGTDCWAKVALSRLTSASQEISLHRWSTAAHRIVQASRILSYLGDHVMLLTSMNLRDYLLLKVELEGTSGEGSVQVKAFRTKVAALFPPLIDALLLSKPPNTISTKSITTTNTIHSSIDANEAANSNSNVVSIGGLVVEERIVNELLSELYEFPDRNPGLYNYAKALEDVESGLLGGFYYKHFLLAANVIGSDARGTMKRAVAALKGGYETPIFPYLDKVRSGLGAKIEGELVERKGMMMNSIIDNYINKPSGGSGCPFGFSSSTSMSATPAASPVTTFKASTPTPPPPAITTATTHKTTTPSADPASTALKQLYIWPDTISPDFQKLVNTRLRHYYQQCGLSSPTDTTATTTTSMCPVQSLNTTTSRKGPLIFLDHAWGGQSPAALHAALIDNAALSLLGNPSWDILFGKIMPKAAKNIKDVLNIPGDVGCNVHFGHNSHELVLKLLSSVMADVCCGTGTSIDTRDINSSTSSRRKVVRPLRVLTSDTEFYSITRQLNRLLEVGVVEVEVVAAQPAETFSQRLIRAATTGTTQPFDVIYVSQITYLTQSTLIPDIPGFFNSLQASLSSMATTPTTTMKQKKQPLVIIDGYHGFAAIPTDLSSVADKCCYIAGLLKHAGCGANVAFVTVPSHIELHPLVTGWLADPSVLVPGSEGIRLGSEVAFDPQLSLQGGTPGYTLPLLTFNHLFNLWKAAIPSPITVQTIHQHVMNLQRQLKSGLASLLTSSPHNTTDNTDTPQHHHQGINLHTLVGGGISCTSSVGCVGEESSKSHTLVFAQPSATASKVVVDALSQQGVVVDCRKEYVRVGIGANHTSEDIEVFLKCIKRVGV